VTTLSPARLKELYRCMLTNRLLEERLVNLYRQGKIVGGLYRSLGQEATSVGAAAALEEGDLLVPLIRNLGALLARGELRIADEQVVNEVAPIDQCVGQIDHARGETADERIAVGAFEGDEDHVVHGRARIMARAR